MTDTPEVRQLTSADLKVWKTIRGASLRNAPEAFGQTYPEFCEQSDASHAKRLEDTMVVASWAGDIVSGCASWQRMSGQSEGHRGMVFGFFVDPKWRGLGHGDALVKAIAADATGKVLQLELHVVRDNVAAARLYQRNGFEIVGEIPRGLCHQGKFFDELHMIRRLDA